MHQVHNLTSEQLAAREVEIIDIASISRDYWSKVIGAPNVDLTTFKSQRTERGPLLKGWMVWSNTDFFSISICANAQWTMVPFRSLVLLLSSDISRYHICKYMLFSLQDSCVPVMTTYKLLIMDAPIWGLGERLEDCIIAVCRYITPCC